jgi:hypothetical protein
MLPELRKAWGKQEKKKRFETADRLKIGVDLSVPKNSFKIVVLQCSFIVIMEFLI